MLVSVPLSPSLLAELVRGEDLGSLRGYATTPGLFETVGYSAEQQEEAERATVIFASIDALATYGTRLVAVAETAVRRPGEEGDDLNGEVEIDHLVWPAVLAVYMDDPAAAEDVARLAPCVADLNLDDAWETPGVVDLVQRWELMWFAPAEAAVMAEGVPAWSAGTPSEGGQGMSVTGEIVVAEGFDAPGRP